MKDNNQSDNIEALIDAGIRSFKIEGRYKDMGYVKNITAHYRKLLDEIIERRPEFARASSGRTTFAFTPDPNQNFNREFTDYFVGGRKEDIGAFDTPKNPGLPIGYVSKVGDKWVELQTDSPDIALNNGDGLCYYTLQKDLAGLAINRAEKVGEGVWRVFPKDPMTSFKDLRAGTLVNRNRDMNWTRLLDKASSERRIGVWLRLDETADGFALTLTDEDGNTVTVEAAHARETAKDAARAEATLREHLGKLGTTPFTAMGIALELSQPWFVPASFLNALRRDAVAALESERAAAYQRPSRATPVEPPAVYPEDTLSYLANVYNHRARDFYAKHGVQVIAAAYESHEETGEVSLMITKHCVRFSLSLCPKQAKGVVGVSGTVRAAPLTLINGSEKLTLRFDCKACEMHVVGKLKPAVAKASAPLNFYKARPVA
jgi:putative protease